VSVTCSSQVLDELAVPLAHGAHVVVHAKPEFWVARGSLSLAADEIRPLGVGELLARLERLKSVLAAEGLFSGDRKRSLPFLPRTVGLVCGRASAAEKDVVENARRRWPAVVFRVCEVAVQGPNAVVEITTAVERLDRDPDVDVIVVTRGGGSIEDLLPFSNEMLIRAVVACTTPVVSAIGHEADTPLLDLVADVRASTPTDAAKRVVPDVAEELARVGQLRTRGIERCISTSNASSPGLLPCAHDRRSHSRCTPSRCASARWTACESAPGAACAIASTALPTSCPTPGRACTRCRRRRRWSAATPSCSAATARSYGPQPTSRPVTSAAAVGRW
jgi:exodeoxyribonuclease VII large subunit